MKAYIGGIIDISGTDWDEKKVSVIFFSGCDFHCPYCRTPEILGFNELLSRDLRDVKKQIISNMNKYEIEGVLFTGGEPCLQKLALHDLAKFCREQGLKIGIETNGSKPDTLKSLLDSKLIDFLRLEIKAPMQSDVFSKVTESATFFRPVEQVMEDCMQSLSLAYEYEHRIKVELRTTIVPMLLYKQEDILNIASMLKDFESTWVLQKFLPETKLVSKRFSAVNSPSDEFLENLRDLIIKEYPSINVELRIDMYSLSMPPPLILLEKSDDEKTK